LSNAGKLTKYLTTVALAIRLTCVCAAQENKDTASTPNYDTKDQAASMQFEKIHRLRTAIKYSGMSSLDDPNGLPASNSTKLRGIIDSIGKLDIPERKPKVNDQAKVLKDSVLSDITAPRLSGQTQNDEDMDVIMMKKAARTAAPVVNILKNSPESVINPLGVAEAIYARGNLKVAYEYFTLALKRTDIQENNFDRPWILLQLGNCLRSEDPLKAYKYYEQLTVEYPTNELSAVAKARQDVINWSTQNGLTTIVERYIGDPNSL
jgi:hypothetical protein